MYSYLMNIFLHIDWNAMITPGISILEKAIRAIFVYFFLILGLRIVGKRELAQLNPFDIVVLFLLSNTVQNALIGNDNSLTGGLIGAAALFIINYVIVRFIYDNNKAENILEGSSDVLIKGGVLMVDKLKKELITLSELEMAARKQGFETLDEIDRAEIDPDGTISFIAKKPEKHDVNYEALLSKINFLCEEVGALKEKVEQKTE